jgi:hypothetical protein
MSDDSDSKERAVSSLLQQGLELYGTGDVAQAFLLWSEALERDPGNEEALDYMRDADRRTKPRGGRSAARAPSIIEDARRLLRAEDSEAALELLTNAPSEGSLECEAMIELLRANLFQQYRRELGDLTQVARLADGAMDSLHSRNLPPSAGFLLSMIDGETALDDLVSVSGMDRFEALRSLSRMHQAGILTWGEA